MQLHNLVNKVCRRLQSLLLENTANGCLQLTMRLKEKQLLNRSSSFTRLVEQAAAASLDCSSVKLIR